MKRNSIFTRNVITIGIVMMVALFIVETVSLYLIQKNRQRSEELFQYSLDSYGKFLEEKFEMIDMQLLSLIGQDYNDLYYTLCNSEDSLALNIAKVQLHRQMQDILTVYGYGFNMYIGISEKNIFLHAFSPDMETSKKIPVRENLEQYIENYSGELGTWEQIWLDGEPYMLKLYKLFNGYAGVYIACNQLLDDLKEYGSDVQAIRLEDRSGQEIAYWGITLNEKKALTFRYRLNNKNLAISVLVENIIPHSKRSYEVILLVCAVCLAMFIIAVTLKIQNGSIFQPLEKLRIAMEKFSQGDTEVRLAGEYENPEITALHDTFNHMVEQINNLKIEVYETKLEQQRIREDYLKLQIQPHFYVNVLNLIHSFAMIQDYGSIQKLSKVTAVYFRYLLGQKGTFVHLKEEIRCVESFIEIQKIRYGDCLETEVYVQEGLENQLILPLILQTFVGNSVKHNIMLVPKLILRVRVEKEAKMLKIVIADNGVGFKPEILDRIKQNKKLENNGEHIGIQNVKARIWAFYKQDADIRIESEPGSTIVTLYMPELTMKEEQNESITCR